MTKWGMGIACFEFMKFSIECVQIQIDIVAKNCKNIISIGLKDFKFMLNIDYTFFHKCFLSTSNYINIIIHNASVYDKFDIK